MRLNRIVFLLAVLAALCSPFSAQAEKKAQAIRALGKVPVLEEGRYKPLDSVARNSLLVIYERQTFRGEQRLSAMEWLAELFFHPSQADTRKVFRVVHPDVQVLIGAEAIDGKFYNFLDIAPALSQLMARARDIQQIEPQLRDAYQRAIINLVEHVTLYQSLKRTLNGLNANTLSDELAEFDQWAGAPLEAFQAQQAGAEVDIGELQAFMLKAAQFRALSQAARVQPIPGEEGGDWKNIWDALVQTAPSGQPPEMVQQYAGLQLAYLSGDWAGMKSRVETIQAELKSKEPRTLQRSKLEAAFNASELFYRTSIAYLLGFLLILVSWVKWERPLNRVAFWLLVGAFVANTAGLVLRMIIQERPPVTNLYSSALFVGWGGVGLGLILERFFRNGLGAATSAILGFLCLIVAHNLAGDGDTMAMLQAVLDTNFWLATHVTIITLGYSATFLAGFLGLVFILRGFFTKGLDSTTVKALDRMVFGIICFALLASFVGTVLGGIWADQSWGRFWGWDPKENGALLIVLWNAIILHARWGKMIRERGTMVAAVFGNIITSWSWFGTNMLGIGLHSYGFMEQAFFWLMAFIFSQLMVMAIGSIPLRLWDSFQKPKPLNTP